MSAWFIFALLSVLTLAGSELSQKISMTQKKIELSAQTNNFFVWIFQGMGGLVITFFSNSFLPIAVSSLWFLALVAIIYFLGGTFYYTSYKTNSPSLSIVLASVSIIVSTTLGVVFLKEPLLVQKLIGVLLICISILIANYKKGLRFDKFNLFALLGGIFYGFAFSLDKFNIVRLTNPQFYVSLLSFSVAIVSLVFCKKLIFREAKKLKPKNFLPMLSAATFGTLFNLFTFKAYSLGGHVGAIDALNTSSVFLVIAFEMFLLRDRKNLRKKVIASTIAFLGIVTLGKIN